MPVPAVLATSWDAEGGLLFDPAKNFVHRRPARTISPALRFPAAIFPGNREEVSELCREIRQKFPDKTIWLYTGYRWEEIKWLPFLDQIDVLIDGRFVQAQADPQLHWRGSANQRVIGVPRTLAANSIVLHDDK